MSRKHETIESLKTELLQVAERHSMNLLHPEVVACSQQLDLLILHSMKARVREAS